MTENKSKPFPLVIGRVSAPHICNTIFNLLDRNAQLNSRSVCSDWKDVVDFETQLWTDPSLYKKAAREGNLELCGKIIECLRTGNKSPHSTPLRIAASRGHVEVCQLIIDCLENKNPTYDEEGNTVLHAAAQSKRGTDPERALQVYRLIMHEVEDKNPKNQDGYTPLHKAVIARNFNLCTLIVEKIQEKNPADDGGQTPLHLAAFEGNLDICKLFLENIQEKNPADNDGLTPLHDAAAMGHLDIVQLIIANIEDKNPPAVDGVTPLHMAAGMDQWQGIFPYAASRQAKYIDICRLILEEVEDKHPVDAAGQTPLDKAREAFQQDVFGEEVLQQLEQLWQA